MKRHDCPRQRAVDGGISRPHRDGDADRTLQPASDVPDLTTLLVGPLLRGGQVNLK